MCAVQILDVAYNRLAGPLPSCLLNLVELFVPGNELSGPLPAPLPTSPLRTLYANLQQGGGLTGMHGGMQGLCLNPKPRTGFIVTPSSSWPTLAVAS